MLMPREGRPRDRYAHGVWAAVRDRQTHGEYAAVMDRQAHDGECVAASDGQVYGARFKFRLRLRLTLELRLRLRLRIRLGLTCACCCVQVTGKHNMVRVLLLRGAGKHMVSVLL